MHSLIGTRKGQITEVFVMPTRQRFAIHNKSDHSSPNTGSLNLGEVDQVSSELQQAKERRSEQIAWFG